MLPRFQNAFDSLSDEPQLVARLTEARSELRSLWTPDKGGRDWGQAHADLMDSLLRRLLHLASERAGEKPAGIAVLATGGYGQRVVAPYSDIDLTFLVDRDDDPPLLREAFRLVMDVLLSGARIKVGYAYRHISDIGRGGLDHHTQTALLDARFLVGDRGLFDRFDQLYLETLHVADFLFQKEFERAKVKIRAGETPFAVEPDLKEGAGGLRDFQTALWMAQARFGKSGDALWRDMVRRKILTGEEMKAFRQAREHLYKVRNLLHLLSGERRDRLSNSRQEEIALKLGYTAEGDSPAVEQFMRHHYTAASTIARLAEKVVQRCLDAPLPLGDTGLASFRRSLVVTDPRKTAENPLWPIDALSYCQRYQLELAPAAVEAIQAACEELPIPDAGPRLIEVLAQGGDVHATLRRMESAGLLKALLPELDACRALVPYDPAHAFTVGEHTLQVLANLMRLRPDTPPSPDLEGYRYVYSTIEAPETLCLAALLHDVGKQWPRTTSGERAPHDVTGAERAAAICRRLGCPPRMTERVVFLVRHHLLLAEVSRLRDLTRPETIREVVRLVGDSDLLRMLYLLTWADTSAVGPGVWTAMTARLLDELVQRCEEALGGATTADPTADPRRMDALRDRLRRRLADPETAPGADPEEVKLHTDAMPAAYLLNTSPEEIALHLAMVGSLLSGESELGIVTEMRGGPTDRDTELILVARDDPEPGLLAKITGVLYAFDIKLHAAQVFTRPVPNGPGVVVDTLRIDYRDRGLDRSMRAELATALGRALTGRETVGDLIARRRRPAALLGKLQAPRLDAGGDHALLDVILPNDSGSVHALCRTITQAGWNIEAARLSSWAGKARCAVYISDPRLGGPGDETSRGRLLRALKIG